MTHLTRRRCNAARLTFEMAYSFHICRRTRANRTCNGHVAAPPPASSLVVLLPQPSIGVPCFLFVADEPRRAHEMQEPFVSHEPEGTRSGGPDGPRVRIAFLVSTNGTTNSPTPWIDLICLDLESPFEKHQPLY